jgi:hypothetical protein
MEGPKDHARSEPVDKVAQEVKVKDKAIATTIDKRAERLEPRDLVAEFDEGKRRFHLDTLKTTEALAKLASERFG